MDVSADANGVLHGGRLYSARTRARPDRRAHAGDHVPRVGCRGCSRPVRSRRIVRRFTRRLCFLGPPARVRAGHGARLGRRTGVRPSQHPGGRGSVARVDGHLVTMWLPTRRKVAFRGPRTSAARDRSLRAPRRQPLPDCAQAVLPDAPLRPARVPSPRVPDDRQAVPLQPPSHSELRRARATWLHADSGCASPQTCATACDLKCIQNEQPSVGRAPLEGCRRRAVCRKRRRWASPPRARGEARGRPIMSTFVRSV